MLDVACGQGTFLTAAAAHGLEVAGVDVSDVALAVARERVPAAALQVGSGEQLPYPDESFDYVTCIGSLEHFENPNAGAAEIRRVLRARGRGVIFVPNLFFSDMSGSGSVTVSSPLRESSSSPNGF